MDESLWEFMVGGSGLTARRADCRMVLCGFVFGAFVVRCGCLVVVNFWFGAGRLVGCGRLVAGLVSGGVW